MQYIHTRTTSKHHQWKQKYLVHCMHWLAKQCVIYSVHLDLQLNRVSINQTNQKTIPVDVCTVSACLWSYDLTATIFKSVYYYYYIISALAICKQCVNYFCRVTTDSSCMFSRSFYAGLLLNYSNSQRVTVNKEPAPCCRHCVSYTTMHNLKQVDT